MLDSLGVGIGIGIGLTCSGFVLALWFEEAECRKENNVYECERVYVPVSPSNAIQSLQETE